MLCYVVAICLFFDLQVLANHVRQTNAKQKKRPRHQDIAVSSESSVSDVGSISSGGRVAKKKARKFFDTVQQVRVTSLTSICHNSTKTTDM